MFFSFSKGIRQFEHPPHHSFIYFLQHTSNKKQKRMNHKRKKQQKYIEMVSIPVSAPAASTRTQFGNDKDNKNRGNIFNATGNLRNNLISDFFLHTEP